VNLDEDLTGIVASLLRPLKTDSDGRFEATGVAPGSYFVDASAPGFVPAETGSTTLYRPGDDIRIALVKGGVITGRVTDSIGNPVVGARVRAIGVREAENQSGAATATITHRFNRMKFLPVRSDWRTDDRGIYRIYGLTAGTYQIAVGGPSLSPEMEGSYESDAATYHPSSTADTATDVAVRPGDEITGIDVRYREAKGYRISGRLKGPSQSGRLMATVGLTRPGSGAVEGTTMAFSSGGQSGFMFNGISDGDYYVCALQIGVELMASMELAVAQPVKVNVRGADVTGLELVLEPLASISGRVVIEPLPKLTKTDCRNRQPAEPREIFLAAIATDDKKSENTLSLYLGEASVTAPNNKGEFAIRSIAAGNYRLDVRLPGEDLYLKSIKVAPATQESKSADVARNGAKVKAGERIRGLTITASEGAAGLRGRVVVGESRKPPRGKMRVFAVPAEKESADEVLRYAEAEVDHEGAFALTNLAPGKYWLVARETGDESAELGRRPLAWDAGGRQGLRFEAEALKKSIELAVCQRVEDYVFQYEPLLAPTTPAAASKGRAPSRPSNPSRGSPSNGEVQPNGGPSPRTDSTSTPAGASKPPKKPGF
jgi:hypothetical protein